MPFSLSSGASDLFMKKVSHAFNNLDDKISFINFEFCFETEGPFHRQCLATEDFYFLANYSLKIINDPDGATCYHI